MATFYIQLSDKLQKISGDLTAANITKALGYTPSDFSGDYNDLENAPMLDDESGEFNIVDELGNVVAKIDAQGVHSIEFIAGEHILSEKANKTEIPSIEGLATEDFVTSQGYLTEHLDISHLVTNDTLSLTMSVVSNNMTSMLQGLNLGINEVNTKAIEADNTANDALVLALGIQEGLTNFATKSELENLDFYELQNNPVINTEEGKLLLVDESGYVGLLLKQDGLYVKDVVAGNHILSNKVDKVDGMGLSAENFTTTLKNKLLSLNNFDDTAINEAITRLQEQMNTLVSDNASEAIESFNEIIAFLDNVKDTENLSSIIAAIEQLIADIVVPTNVSELTNDSGYITDEALEPLATKKELSSAVSNIDFDHINNTPFTSDDSGEFNIIDKAGNIGLKVSLEGIYVKDVIAGEHILSNKADVDIITVLEARIVELENKLLTISDTLLSNG